MRKARVHCAHHPRQHGAVAHAGIEDAQGRRPRMDTRKFKRNALGNDPLFGTGMNEQKIFLPVLEKPEVAARVAPFQRRHILWWRGRTARQAITEKGVDAIESIGRDTLAFAQP